MSFSYFLLDVFTDRLFSGNQLAVFPDASDIDPSLFQSIAREFNLSETVFLLRSDQGTPPAMRIFTPARELPTAGHPTIGTAYLLAKESGNKEIIVNQKVGEIQVTIEYASGEPDLLTMQQPLPKYGRILSDRKAMVETLGLDIDDLADHPVQEVSCGNNVLLIPLRNAAALEKIRIKTHLLEKISRDIDTTMLYCFSVSGVKGGDVQGRMFAPLLGIYEDPATGSANGPLACYLVKHDLLSMPVLSLQGYEMGRPSQLHLDVRLNDQKEVMEVKVGGKCRLVGKGELFLEQ